MKGDFTRNTFQRDKNYSSVRMQQGRVQLDADWNEQLDIDAHSSRTTHGDVIGPCGVPIEGGGFEISLVTGNRDLFISSGRIYVDGILYELGMDSLPVSFPSNKSAQLPALTLDGRPLKENQWVEIKGAGKVQRLKITQVVGRTRTLEFNKNVLQALRNAKNPRLGRVTTYLTQADYPEPTSGILRPLPGAPGPNAAVAFLAYLDLWEQHVTTLQDDELREVALGVSGPDTTTRTRLVGQVKLMRLRDGLGPKPSCSQYGPGWTPKGAESSGLLAARAEISDEKEGPCIVPPGAGYHRLENQLYRVEIHEKGGIGDATYKWSRENGSIVVGWEKQDSVNPRKLTVSSVGRDAVLGIAADDWVEITDDMRELHGKPGVMAQVEKVDELVITLKAGTISDPEDTTATDVDKEDFPLHPRIRRWESNGAEELRIPGGNDGWIKLEDGVEIHFQAGGVYQTGDSWLIPARTITGEVQWPEDEVTGKPLFEPSQFIKHHYCPLALLAFNPANKKWSVLSDCRKQFPPLTELIRFFHVSGDGQEAMPGATLPRPLQVGVNNGQWPVAGARVRFTVVGGSGALKDTLEDNCSSVGGGGTAVSVETDANGVAACCWTLDDVSHSQRVEATLLDIDGRTISGLTPLQFNASTSIASQVAYDPSDCSNLKKATTVQEAIDILCQVQEGGGCAVTVGEEGEFRRLDEAIFTLLEQGQNDICICLLPGDHSVKGLELSRNFQQEDLHLSIKGCGASSRILMEESWRLRELRSFSLQDVTVEPLFVIELEEGLISLRGISDVKIAGSKIQGLTEAGALLHIALADRVTLANNVFEAARFASLQPERAIFDELGIEFLAELYSLPEQGAISSFEFRKFAKEAGLRIAEIGPDERAELAKMIQDRVSSQSMQRQLSEAELIGFSRLYMTMQGAEKLTARTIYEQLLDIRRAAVKSRPGVAIVLAAEVRPDQPLMDEISILDEDDVTLLENNQISGSLSLYGPPATSKDLSELLANNFLKQLEADIQESKIRIRGLMGTLHMRGNSLTTVTVARETLERLHKMGQDGNETGRTLFEVFSRCQFSDNIFEGARHVVIGRHLAWTANQFTFSAVPSTTTPTPAQRQIVAGIVIGEATTYVGNLAARPRTVIQNASRLMENVANIDMAIA